MDTIEIEKYLNEIHPSLKFNVYAANRLPITIQVPAYIISNLDPDSKPGSHWIAIHIDKNRVGQYFDSYGRPPSGYHRAFLKRNSRLWGYNTKKIQDDWTSFCGEYCLMYLYYKFHGDTMRDFVNLFGENTMNNDIFLHNVFKHTFNCYNI